MILLFYILLIHHTTAINTALFVGTDYSDIFTDAKFSSSTMQWLAISNYKLKIINANNFNLQMTVQLPYIAEQISLQAQNHTTDSLKIAIAHSGYISFYDTATDHIDTITTNTQITTIKSISYCSNGFVYVFDQSGIMYQISLSTITKCTSFGWSNQYAKVHPIHNTWIYGLSSTVSPRDIEKWVVDGSTLNVCSYTNNDSPLNGEYNMDQPFFFSYDGRFIFMNTGLVLYSSHDSKDMTVAGTFTDVYSRYNYYSKFISITQMKYYPYYVYAIKLSYSSNFKYSIVQYNWPYLNSLTEINIPSAFNLGNSVFVWDTFIAMECGTDNQTLYILGLARQGTILQSIVAYINIKDNFKNNTSMYSMINMSDPKYFESEHLKWNIVFSEGNNFTDIAFSSSNAKWIAITDDNNLIIVDANNFTISNNIKLPLTANKVSLQPKQNASDPLKIAIAHSSYISFYNSKTNALDTISVPITTSTSIPYCGNNFVYPFPSEWVDMYQISLNGSTLCSSWSVYAGTYAKANPVHDNWIYADDGKWIVDLSTNSKCSIVRKGGNSFSSPWWYSYDGSLIFSWKGKVVRCTNGNDDMAVAGTFEDVYGETSYTYPVDGFVWITQMKHYPYYIFGLKSFSNKYYINQYDWPYLKLLKQTEIPNKFNLSNVIFEWDTFISMEVADSDQRLYISGIAKQGIILRPFISYVEIGKYVTNTTSSPTNVLTSPNYFKSDKLTWFVASYERGTFEDIVFNSITSQWISINENNLMILDANNFNLSNYVTLPLNAHKVSFQPQNNSVNSMKIAIAHSGYVSFYDYGTNNVSITTVNVPIITPESITYCSNGFVYAIDQKGAIYQVNLTTSTQCSTIGYSSNRYIKVNPVNDTWIYAVLSSNIQKLVVSGSTTMNQCSITKSYSPYYSNYIKWGAPFFFSYDGRFIFMTTGLVLHSSDDTTDMTIAGLFSDVYKNYSYPYYSRFVWITQMKKNPYYVYGLKTSGSSGKYTYTVNLYDWPYLNLIDELQIPAVFNLSNSLSTWETLTAVEVDDDNQQKLYISGNMKQGVLDKSIVGIVYVRNSSINATKTQLKPVISPTYYFKANKLSWSVAFYEGSINDIVFSPNTSQWIGIDNKNLIIMDAKNFNLTNYIKLPLNGNKVSLHPQNNAIDALKIAITHPTYVSFYDSSTNNISTVSVPLMMESDGSIVYAPNGFVYILEDSMYQVSLNGSVKCSSWAYGEYTKLNPIHNTWIYSDKEKWVVDGSKSSECSMVYKSYSGRDDKSVAHPFFFSYDGSFIFSWNGKVVRSTDSDKDFTLAGIFEDVYDQTGYHYPDNGFVWITQMKHFPYYVFGLKSTPTNYTINIYDWPYLNLLNKIEIPNTFNVNNSVFEWDSFTALEFAENNDQILYISGIAKHVQGLILKSVFGQIDISNYSTNETVIPPPDNVISPVNHVNQTDLTWHIASYEQGTFEDIVFSSTTSQWVGLDNNNLIVVNGSDIHLSNYIRLPLNGHKVSIQPHNKRSLKVAVAHSNYISFYDSNTNKVQTVNVPITKSTSIPYCSNGFVYSFPEEDQWVDIYQITSNTSILCSSWSA
eukprot:257787_1